jgi:hypothetical protein
MYNKLVTNDQLPIQSIAKVFKWDLIDQRTPKRLCIITAIPGIRNIYRIFSKDGMSLQELERTNCFSAEDQAIILSEFDKW